MDTLPHVHIQAVSTFLLLWVVQQVSPGSLADYPHEGLLLAASLCPDPGGKAASPTPGKGMASQKDRVQLCPLVSPPVPVPGLGRLRWNCLVLSAF